MPIPTFDRMFNPLLEALRNLGGSGSNAELVDETARIIGLTDEELEEQTSRGQPRFAYRLAWARSYLKAFGLIENSERGVWSLTQRGTETQKVDPAEVKRFVRSRRLTPVEAASAGPDEEDTADTEAGEESWRENLLELLLGLDPGKFERLCQRILRESGFVQVEVTGRSGDGGIDGTGTVELGGLLAFPVLFQCKRYQGGVGPSVVRDFRGAMVGRADRGLILTTGIFSREARREARRDGAPPIDLVDRDRLLDKLKELHLGVEVELVESVSIDSEWFSNL
jgi:restriction system protein